MDSKLIFIKADNLLSKVIWETGSDFGWTYCGRSDDLKKELLNERITKHFGSNEIYFVINRHDSKLVDKSEIISLILAYIDSTDMTFWSEDFCHVLEIKSIGVFRAGGLKYQG
jgi:hypothetical protein